MITYLWKKVDRFLDTITKELGDNRTLICWIYAAAYLMLIFYCVKHNPSSHNTAIVATSGLVGTILASYVLSKSYEKVNVKKIGVINVPVNTEDDSGESD